MAKPFKLQTVLDYRSTLEKEAQQQLASSLRRQGDILTDIHQERTRLNSMVADLEKHKLVGMSMGDLYLYQSSILHREQLVAELERRLEKINQEISTRRAELTRTCKNRQVMEKLKEKQNAAYQRTLFRRESAQLDEIGLRCKEYQP